MGQNLVCHCDCNSATAALKDCELDFQRKSQPRSSSPSHARLNASLDPVEPAQSQEAEVVDRALRHFVKALSNSEEAGAVGSLITELWPLLLPELGKTLERCTRQSLEHALTRLPGGLRGEARLTSVSPRDVVHIGPVYSCRECVGNSNGREVALRLRFESDADLELRLGNIGLLVSSLSFEGDASLVFQTQPVDDKCSALAGIHFGFINPPEVRLGLMRLDGVRDWSEIDGRTQNLINSIFRNVLVLPQHFGLPLSSGSRQSRPTQQEQPWLSPKPRGLMRVRILQVRGLLAQDAEGSESLDPFCCVRLGTCEMRTQTCYKTCSPEWDNASGDFLVYDERQCLQLDVFNANKSVVNDLLGSMQKGCSIAKLLHLQAEAGVVACSGTEAGVWLPLEDSIDDKASGKPYGARGAAIRLHISYFSLEQPGPQLKIGPATQDQRNVVPMLVSVYLHGMDGLPAKQAESAAVRLKVEGRSTISGDCCLISSGNAPDRWGWQESLYALVRNINSAAARLEIKVQERWLRLTEADLPVHELLRSTSEVQTSYRLQYAGSVVHVRVSWQLHTLAVKEDQHALKCLLGASADQLSGFSPAGFPEFHTGLPAPAQPSRSSPRGSSDVSLTILDNASSNITASTDGADVSVQNSATLVQKKKKVKRKVTFGGDAEIILTASDFAAPGTHEVEATETKSPTKEVDLGPIQPGGGATMGPMTAYLAERALREKPAVTSNVAGIRPTAQGQESSSDNVPRSPDFPSPVGQESSDDVPRSPDLPSPVGMEAISRDLQSRPCSWSDGAGGWHPTLMRCEVQPRTRCWGPMSWADNVDGALMHSAD